MLRNLTLVGILACGIASAGHSQTIGTPVYMAPYRAFSSMELGGMISDPGKGLALEGAYRYGYRKFDIGIRGGIISVDGPNGGDIATDNEVSLLVGADVRFRVIEHTEDFPFDGSFTAGVGGALGDISQAYLPIGLSFGRRIELEGGVSFVPYAHPVLVPTFGDSDDMLVALGLGVDVKVSRALDVRLSGGVGDIEGISIGISWIK